MATLTVTSPEVRTSPFPRAKQQKHTHVGYGAGETTLNMVIHQNPFSVTLDAWAMLVGSLLLVGGMHFLQASLFQALIVAVPVVLLMRNDYLNFLLLGPGGTPPTFRGYLRLLDRKSVV